MFWSITTLLLLILAKTLPDDQDNMEKELAKYVEGQLQQAEAKKEQYSLSMKYKDIDSKIFNDSQRFKILDDELTQYGNDSIVSIEDRMSSFDAAAARESWIFIEDALREIAILSNLHQDDDDYEPIEGEVWDAPPMEEDEGRNHDNEGESENERKGFGELETLL